MPIPDKDQINKEIEFALQDILELIPNPKSYQIEIVQTNLRLVYLGAWISAQGALAEESLKKVGK